MPLVALRLSCVPVVRALRVAPVVRAAYDYLHIVLLLVHKNRFLITYYRFMCASFARSLVPFIPLCNISNYLASFCFRFAYLPCCVLFSLPFTKDNQHNV